MRVPFKERPPDTDLQRAPLLEAQVEIEIAAGDIARARSAADELTRVAARFAEQGAGRRRNACSRKGAARGRRSGGRERLCAEAARLWSEIGAPYEAALARAGFADALRASGSEQRAALELEAARTVLDRIEAERTADDAVPVARRRRGRVKLFRRGGRLLVGELRRPHGASARPQGHPVPRAVARRPLAASSTCSTSSPPKAAGPARPGAGRAAGLSHTAPRRCRRDARRASQGRLPPAPRRDRGRHRAGARLEDTERETQADAERDFLVRELSRAVGLDGRDRRAASTSERARVSVTRAVRQAIVRVGEHHPELGEHLGPTS